MMNYGMKKRILSLVLCISMILPMVAQLVPVYSVETENQTTNYGSAIGAIAEWDVTSILLAANPNEVSSDVVNGADPSAFPRKLTIVNYYYDEVNNQVWYKVDAAPGYTWPEEYANYHWVYDYAVEIVSQNGEVGVFDAEGNAISSVTMPVLEKVEISAESSLQGSVQYQWQIEYEDGKWADIYGEDKAELTLSIGMLATLLDSDSVNVRCVTTSASKTVTSDEIKVTVDFSSLEKPEDPENPENPPVAEDTAAITVDGVEAAETTIEYDDYNANNELIENGTKTLGVVTTLTGEYTIVWQGRVGGEETGEWKDLATNTTYELSRYYLQYNGVFGSSTYKAYIRVVLTQGETVVESDTLVVTINEHNPLLYYGAIENTVTTSNGNDVAVTVAGSLPDDASLSLTDATGTTVPGVEEEEIALALDVKITQNGAEWQPAEGEKVYVSIPAYKLGLVDGQYFTVYHIHDGTTELLGPFKVEDDCVTFEIDGFSVVVISTNYGAAIGGVAEFDRTGYVLLNSGAVNFDGQMVDVDLLPAKVVIKNYIFDDELGKLFYEIDATPGYTWPAEYADLHWCYSDVLTNIDVNGSMGMFDEDGDPVAYVELQPSDKPTYTVQSSLTGSVKYQWQICYDIQNYLWMDIDGQTDASFTVSYAMLASMLDENGMCAVRCMVSNAVKTQEGYPLVIAYTDGTTDEPSVEYYANITVNGEETDSAELADQDYYWDSENGVEISIENGSLNLSVNSNLTGDDVTYQWQALSGTDWVTLSTSKDYQLIFRDLAWYQAYSVSTAYVRVVVTQGETVVESNQLTINIVPAIMNLMVEFAAEESEDSVCAAAEFDSEPCAADAFDDTLSTSDEAAAADDTVTITVQFINGQTGEPVDRAEDIFDIQYGTNLKQYDETSSLKLPVVEGYSPYLGDDTTTPLPADWVLEKANVTADETIIIKYWPAKVNYTVIYYWQNVDDDKYTEHERVTGQQFTGSEPVIVEKQYEGFLRLLYENVPCASDGSTVIEVYYDRLYFKMLFNLDGGYGVQPVYARYGTPVTVTNPTKAGYSFMGWNALNGPNSDGNDETVDITNFTNILIPAEHTNYKAIWKATEAAKVTVIVWGQNANNNEYSYMSKTEDGTDLTNLYFLAKPGTTVTYNPNGGNICGYTEEHKHGTDCEVTCGQTEHTHSAVDGDCYELICEQESHTHSNSCYPGATDTEFSWSESETYVKPREGAVDGQIGESYSWYFVGEAATGNKYIRINGTWYKYTGTAAVGSIVTMNCGQSESTHTHTDACYQLTCTTKVHEHTDACYAGCTKEEHTHGATCKPSISMNSALWTLNTEKTGSVTVAADGTTTLNVYYDRTKFTVTFNSDGGGKNYATLNKKWGESIRTEFIQASTDAGSYMWSENSSASNGPWTSFLAVMPQENRDYYAYVSSSNTTYKATYYGLKLGGTVGVESDYEVLFPIEFKYGGNLHITEEEFEKIEGFTLNEAMSSDEGDSYNNSKFYYDRNSYNLAFNNYGTIEQNYSVQFEAPLASYGSLTLDASKAPAFYQPGSVTFKGWYAAPQTPGDFNFESVTPFNFGKSTMPASDLILYAWWQPVTHNVRFFYGEEYIATNTVYKATVDGTEITYDYDVPHGSTVQNPYNPPNDPTKGKYKFVGWFYRDDNGQEQMWDFANTTVTRDTDIYAKWSSNTLMEYEVKFMWKNPETGEEIEIAAPITGSALGGNSKTFDAKGNADLYAGYQTGYFPEVASHTITIDLDDTSKNSFVFWYQKVDKVPYTVEYIDRATGEAVVGTDGVTYNAVTYADNNKAIVTEKALMIPGFLPEEYMITLTVKPTGENVITFYYNKDETNGIYVVHYWTENLNGTFSEHSTFTGRGVKESTVNAAIKDIENFTYIPGYENATTGQKEVLSGQIAVGSVLELHVFYERNTYPYKVQYMEDGTTKELADSKTVTGKLWEQIVTENAITIQNYTLVGEDQISIQIQKDTEDPTVNIITFYYAEDKVKINYVVANGVGGTVDPQSETLKVVSGEAQGSTATANTGYDFVGWYSDAACTNKVSTDAKYVPDKVDGLNVAATYYAKFEELTATINYKVVGPTGAIDNYGTYGTVTPTSETVTVVTGRATGSTAEATSKVYKFVGWYSDAACENKVSDSATYVPTKDANALWDDVTTYYAKFEYNRTSLTIVKAGAEAWEAIDPNQTFMFDIFDSKGNLLTTVTVHGDSWSVTVEGLTVGEKYTVTEKTDWSWRYNCTGWTFGSDSGIGASATITMGVVGNQITFTNERSESKWLDGDSWCDNIFG